MRSSILRLACVLAVGVLCFLSPERASAGPLRDRIREARPGILIPKPSGPASCASCPSGRAAAAPAWVASRGAIHPPRVYSSSGGGCSGGSCPATVTAPSCADGRCPLPR